LIVLSLKLKRWFGWLALVALASQAGLPTLRIATARAGELRAEAVLATSLCSKPASSFADGVAALLNPWQQHSSKKQHHHCDSCLQNVDGASFILHAYARAFAPPQSNSCFADFAGVRAKFQQALIPPSRGPPPNA
jgi:hypothetical protein